MTDTSPVSTTAPQGDVMPAVVSGSNEVDGYIEPAGDRMDADDRMNADSMNADDPMNDEPDADTAAVPDDELLVREGDVAGDYLERLLDIADYDGDIDLDVEGDRAVVAIVGGDLQQLVGPNGSTLEALQELTRLAVQQRTGVRSRLMLDIDGYRARRRLDLAKLARTTAEKVLSSGEPVRLTAMNPFERKVVHDVITQVDGVHSESEGEEPQRRVVVSLDP